MTLTLILFILGIIFCFLMTWGVGANDLANVMSTTMGSKAVTVRQAIIISIIFEFAGAFLGGGGVTETMRDGIINTSELGNDPLILIEGMLSLLIACTIWMNLASFIGVPVSITNALVGSMVGFGTVVLGVNAVHWHQVSHIAIGWVTSPLISGITAYLLFLSIQQTIFIQSDPLQKAKQYIPIYLFLVGSVLSYITVFKGLNHFHIHLDLKQDLIVTLVSSVILTIVGLAIIKRIPEYHNFRRKDKFTQVEKYFAILMGMTACAMVFAHGANDVSLADRKSVV
jgi:PiT family inorganic phosphate transporter